MLNINSKIQTLFATGGATVPARQSVARLITVLFVVMSAMFILTGCGLGSLIKALDSGNLPCNLNPFQEKCYPEITAQLLAGKSKINLTEGEIADETPEQKAAREAQIALRAEQEKARKEALAKYAPQRQALIEPVVAECTVNPQAERCRDAFVWCSDFENTNSPECATALAAEEGVFSCLKDPYNEACEQQTALQETISGQVPVRDENGDIELDENGEEMTELKEVSLVENTRQARINYCRDDNDQGVANIEANPVLCESTVTNVCEDDDNPSGVFDVFCKDEPGVTDYADAREEIANGCRDKSLTTVEQGCTSVVVFCNATPFGNPNCDIPAFDIARKTRVDLCITANTTATTNECGIELANNPCFGDPFTDSVDCASEFNLGNAENVKTAKQSRATLCVNAFIANRYPDICGGAVAKEACVTDPFGGTCAEGLGAGHIMAKQTRARYCIVGDRTADSLCLGATNQSCMQNPYDTDCAAFFGTTDQDKNAQQFRTNHCETQITAGTVTSDDLCDSYLSEGVACKSNPFRKTPVVECTDSKYNANRQTIVEDCESGARTAGCTSNFINSCLDNPFVRFLVPGSNPADNNLIPNDEACGASHFDSTRLKSQTRLVNECRAGTRTGEAEKACGADSGVIKTCNRAPFVSYEGDVCAPAYFDGARADKIASCLVSGATGCEATFELPNTATWVQSFRDGTALAALNTTTAKNQFLLGTADGIDTTGTNATATTLTIANDAKNGVGFFTANSKFYAGLFSGANLGEPLSDATKNGEWTGSLQAVVGSSATPSAVLPMTLTVTYGGTNTINAFVASGSNHFLLDGTFTAEGVIEGTVNYGAFTGGVEGTPAGGRGTNGILTGLIGQDGALGAFHSNESETSGYAGGFVATKTAE